LLINKIVELKKTKEALVHKNDLMQEDLDKNGEKYTQEVGFV
jgi:hypothetical protein